MPALRRLLAALPTLLLAAAGPAAAFVNPPGGETGAITPRELGIVRLADPQQARTLDASAAWQGFQSRYGTWQAEWNVLTGSPVWAFGKPIPLAGFHDDAAAVDQALRSWIAGNPQMFGDSPALETVSAIKLGHEWSVSYRQSVGGLPVLSARWEFGVWEDGRLFTFGADVVRPPAKTVLVPMIPASVARAAATSGLAFNAGTDAIEGGDAPAVLPYVGEAGLEYRVVYPVTVKTATPIGNWITLVDASDGHVFARQSRIRYAIAGNVSGGIHPLFPTDPLSSRNFAHLTVNVGSSSVATDASGNYSVSTSGTQTVTAHLTGPLCNVARQDLGLNANFTTSASDPSTVNIVWGAGNSQDSERDAFYNVNFVHDYEVLIQPSYNATDYAMPTGVNINQTCNAFWDGNGLNFFAAGGGCPNTATIPDVVYHEYGHGVNDKIYESVGQPFGMQNGALHEGTADVNAAFVEDSPLIGKGFTGPGTFLRNLSNTNTWPQDASGDPHATGLIIGGAFWDFRLAVGLPVARSIALLAKYLAPDDPDDGIAMHKYFFAAVQVDDDNGDLTDGTPHIGQLVSAFNAHGIGTSFDMQFTHTPLADQPGFGPYPIVAGIQYSPSAPFGSLNASSCALHYSVNGGPYQTVPMAPSGPPNTFAAEIPPQHAGLVRYYLSASDNFGAASTSPPFAPAVNVNSFIAGPASTVFLHDMESDQGWIGGQPGDNATTGKWVWVDPTESDVNGVFCQPEDDHTPSPGFLCWVTGNALPGQAAGTNDVDNGKTTLLSPLFSATAGGVANPVIRYWRWYSNNLGAAPGTDFWHVDIANDGGDNWVPVENTNVSSNAWVPITFMISEYVTPTNTMRMRFIAEDAGSPSLVEAAVDDFQLLAFPGGTTGVPPAGGASASFRLADAAPNPFSSPTRLDYTLAETGDVSLRVFDVGGRMVRTLVSAREPAGEHSATWDGRDDQGRSLSSGTYFVSLKVAGREAAKPVVLVR